MRVLWDSALKAAGLGQTGTDDAVVDIMVGWDRGAVAVLPLAVLPRVCGSRRPESRDVVERTKQTLFSTVMVAVAVAVAAY